MAVRPKKRFTASRFIAPLATLMIMGYFAFHALNGQYGLRAHASMKVKIAELEQLKLDKQSELDLLEARVKLLREGTMERDMVDEQVRRQLNMLRDDEVMILLD